MQYLSHWRSTIIAAVLFHVVLLSAVSSLWDFSTDKQDDEILEAEAVEWVEDDTTENTPDTVEQQPEEVSQVSEVVPEFEFPPLIIPQIPEIPTYVRPTPPPPPLIVETPPAATTDNTAEKFSGEKTEDKPVVDTVKKVKVISKVYPKDVTEELLATGVISRAEKIRRGTVLVRVIIGTDGRVKKTEIKRGGGYDERGNIINALIETAASRWVFEPYLDDDNKPREMPTQIEFKPTDF